MTQDEIKAEVIAIAAKTCKVDADSISEETRWKEDLGVNSVYAMKVCALLKMKTGADTTPGDLAQNETVGDTIAMVCAKTQG